MERTLGEATLPTGETMTIRQVTPPDARWGERVRRLLGHKTTPYDAHLDAAVADECAPLETRFTVGTIGEEAVGNVMTVERHGVGILGHVYTAPEWRRRGICHQLFAPLMEDFRARGGKVLLLGTGYQSSAYRIYATFGFRDWEPGHPGLMRYDNPDDPGFLARFFAPASGKVTPADWGHWPLVALLASVPSPVHLRHLTVRLWGVGLLEGPFCGVLVERNRRPEVCSALVLESPTGAALALATLAPDRRWAGELFLLDLFAHPDAAPADLERLVAALPLAGRRVQCIADTQDGQKVCALAANGFVREAVLPRQFQEGGVWRDAWVYGR